MPATMPANNSYSADNNVVSGEKPVGDHYTFGAPPQAGDHEGARTYVVNTETLGGQELPRNVITANQSFYGNSRFRTFSLQSETSVSSKASTLVPGDVRYKIPQSGTGPVIVERGSRRKRRMGTKIQGGLLIHYLNSVGPELGPITVTRTIISDPTLPKGAVIPKQGEAKWDPLNLSGDEEKESVNPLVKKDPAFAGFVVRDSGYRPVGHDTPFPYRGPDFRFLQTLEQMKQELEAERLAKEGQTLQTIAAQTIAPQTIAPQTIATTLTTVTGESVPLPENFVRRYYEPSFHTTSNVAGWDPVVRNTAGSYMTYGAEFDTILPAYGGQFNTVLPDSTISPTYISPGTLNQTCGLTASMTAAGYTQIGGATTTTISPTTISPTAAVEPRTAIPYDEYKGGLKGGMYGSPTPIVETRTLPQSDIPYTVGAGLVDAPLVLFPSSRPAVKKYEGEKPK